MVRKEWEMRARNKGSQLFIKYRQRKGRLTASICHDGSKHRREAESCAFRHICSSFHSLYTRKTSSLHAVNIDLASIFRVVALARNENSGQRGVYESI
jgi:hypothetical protein